MNGAVLYIDDNEDNILVVQRVLRRARPDIQLHTARTGGDGIRAAASIRPDLILLDNRLPDTSGEQVLHKLAADPVTTAIPVIILSGDTGRLTARELLAAGAVDFLAKPFDIHQFLTLIDSYLHWPQIR
jgi:CheY-like chemotaxis protein